MLFHFVDALAKVSPQCEIFLFTDESLKDEEFSQSPYRVVVEQAVSPLLQRLFDFWMAFQLPALMVKHEIDVFFSPNTKFPFTSIPCFTTVHGLEWYFYPQGYTLLERIKQWTWFRLCTRYSAGIITFSENTKSDIKKICSHLSIPMCMVHEGIGVQFRQLGSEELSPAILLKHGIRQPFILSVCSLDPRKNLDTLILAFAGAVRESGVSHQLVLVGKSGRNAERLHRLARDCGVWERICFAGYISDEELVQLYNHAQLFVYPSKYEGFGLPVIEAMASGIPVITSNVSSLPEVANGAALLVDPYSVTELGEAIVRCLKDDLLRKSLSHAGLERASRFSWVEMTRRICEFMQEEWRA